MKSAPLPSDEPQRLAALRDYQILDSVPEQVFDDLTQLAAHICDAPIALVSLIDADRQWFKSKVGLEAQETPRDLAFCAHAILDYELFVVENALDDERFADNPLVSGDPDIRFYAGAPLIEPDGHAMGTLCVIDRVPRQLSPAQEDALRSLARQTVSQMELRKKLREQVELNQRLRVARLEAERANKTKSRFLAHMSHELRTPLNAIIGFSRVLRKMLSDSMGNKQPLYCDRITANGLHLLELVNNVLDLSRVEAEQMTVTAETFDVRELVDEVTGQVEPLVSQNGNSLTISMDAAGSMTSDRMKIHQCLTNLLSNACKFTKDGSIRLTVVPDTRDGDPWIRLEVMDTGKGMSPEELGRVFDEFYRAERPEAGHTEGTGLGLAITHRFCRLLGGDIKARSQQEVGSTFVIQLPMMLGAKTETAIPDAEGAVAETR